MKDKWMAQGHTASSRWTGTQIKIQECLQAPVTTMSPYAALAGTSPLSGLHLSTAHQAQHLTRNYVCQGKGHLSTSEQRGLLGEQHSCPRPCCSARPH